jgi:uncharacterized damage-inducible protein DinB
MTTSLGAVYLQELEAEAAATRHCLERVPSDDPNWKPHEKSMGLGYLAYLVAEIPRWVAVQATIGEIDFQTFVHEDVKTNEQLLAYFDKNMEEARVALAAVTDEQLEHDVFVLKSGEQIFMTSPKGASIGSSINHMVHHRGQLSVYLRLKDIPVPAIYGSSADEAAF